MLVFVLALGAAAFFGLGSVVQQLAAATAPPETALSFRLLWYLLHQRLWLAGFASSLAGNGLSTTAIAAGGVALAQPLFTSRLLFAVVLTAVFTKIRVPRRDWSAAVMTAAGLGVFVAIGNPRKGHPLLASSLSWGVALGAVAVGVGVLVLVARRAEVTRAAFALGAAAGLLFGLQSSLTETSTTYLSRQGLGALLHWQPYLLAVVAIYGALLIQSAYEMAPLPASFPALVTVEPLTGTIIGVTVLHGALRVTPGALAGEVGGLIVMVAGVALLARSPLVTGQLSALQRRREEGQAYCTAAEIERMLAETEVTVSDYRKVSAADGSRAHGSPSGPGHHVRRATRQLERLDALIVDMHRLREDEIRHLRELPTKERMTLAPLEQELDERQERIEEWAERLRAEFTRLCSSRDEC